MSNAQTAAGLAPKRRFRSKSLQVQLQQALLHAESLEKLKPSDDSISRMKLAQVRITSLRWLIGRQDKAKAQQLNRLADELKRAKSEIERLKGELAAKSTAVTVSPVTDIEQALAKFNADQGGQQ